MRWTLNDNGLLSSLVNNACSKLLDYNYMVKCCSVVFTAHKERKIKEKRKKTPPPLTS